MSIRKLAGQENPLFRGLRVIVGRHLLRGYMELPQPNRRIERVKSHRGNGTETRGKSQLMCVTSDVTPWLAERSVSEQKSLFLFRKAPTKILRAP